MPDLRISASEMFALEITRAILAQPSPLGDTSGPWLHVDVASSPAERGGLRRKVYVWVVIHGFDTTFETVCYLSKEGNRWTYGAVLFTGTSETMPGNSQVFDVSLEDHKIILKPMRP